MKYVIHNLLTSAKRPFSAAARRKRMQKFVETFPLQEGTRVIDLGGTPQFWDSYPTPLDITIVNLPGFNPPEPPASRHAITLVEGDATNVDFAADNSFEFCFSNSVIEHVGDEAKQEDFAKEVSRLAPAYWVQTPSIWFPIEAHSNMPFWWFYPESLRQRLLARWRKKLPAWTEMVETTTVLKRAWIQELFPDATIWTERTAGFPKSYVAHSPAPAP